MDKTEGRQIAAIFDSHALLLEAVARDLEAAGIAAINTKASAKQYRHNAEELRAGKEQTKLE